jgi:hypothetical protein
LFFGKSTPFGDHGGAEGRRHQKYLATDAGADSILSPHVAWESV